MPAWDAPVVVEHGGDEAEDVEKPAAVGTRYVHAQVARTQDIVTMCMYATFLLAVGVVLREFSDLDSSVVLTLSAAVQCFGYAVLLHKVQSSQTVAGLSARSLELYALFFCFRLTSTCQRSGYIPADKSGDWVYQAFDGCSLLMVLQLLHAVHRGCKRTYLRELDLGLECYVVLPCCVLLGCYVHAHREHTVLFDVIWQISLLLDAVALVPQLVMMYQLPTVDGLNAHYVAAVVLSRSMAFGFWAWSFPELAEAEHGSHTVGWVIVGTHGFQLLVSAEFMLRYSRAVIATGSEALKVLDEL